MLGISIGFLSMIKKPKSAGILGRPKASASGVPTICSRITAISAPKSHPRIGTLENISRILFFNPVSGADNLLFVTST